MNTKRHRWLQLAPLPPGATPTDLVGIHRDQMHRAVTKAIGKKGGDFAAEITISLRDGQEPRPHLVMARRYPLCRDGWVHIAATPCTGDYAEYFAQPAPAEVARWAVDAYAQFAPYRAVVSCQGAAQ